METEGGNNSEPNSRGGMGRGNVCDQESGHRRGELPAQEPLCVVRPLDVLSRQSDVD
jgi:hypothetical protein